MSSVVSTFCYSLKTLYLFTKSDIKTIIVPISMFAAVSAPTVSLRRMPHVIFWLWIHLLNLCVSNQTLAPEEDSVNKPWRPIPSGRITIIWAQRLKWSVLPACFLVSALYDVVGISTIFTILAWAYNERGMHSTWPMKQICNAGGYATLEMGATTIAANHAGLDNVSLIAVAASGLVILTTGWAQDFPDQDGDRLQGNMTIPIAAPRAARVFLPATLLAWSFALTAVWELGFRIAVPLLLLSGVVGLRFWLLRSTKQDRFSFALYNVWLTCVHLLPSTSRFSILA